MRRKIATLRINEAPPRRRAAAAKQSVKYFTSTRRAYFHIMARPWSRSCAQQHAERVSPSIRVSFSDDIMRNHHGNRERRSMLPSC